MSVVSAGKAGPGRIVPGRQGGPRKQRRFDTPFALGMAAGVLINLALFMALYFRADPEIPQRAPEAIPVELVQQPPAPQPQPQTKTEPEKPRAEQPKIDTKYMSSGGDAQDEPLGAPETGSPDVEQKLEDAEKQAQQAEQQTTEKPNEKKDKGAAEKHEEPIGPLPAWARQVTQGYGATRATRGASASGATGGGNLYLNKMREKISKALGTMNIALPQRPGLKNFLIVVLNQNN